MAFTPGCGKSSLTRRRFNELAERWICTKPVAFTIDICGTPGCGKSSLMRRHLDGEFGSESLKSCTLVFHTNKGVYYLNCNEGISDNPDGRIIMFNLCSDFDKEVKTMESVLCRNDKPSILCGNMIDRKDARNPDSLKQIMTDYSVSYYYAISAKSFYNYEKPFLSLLKEITNQPDLNFIAIA